MDLEKFLAGTKILEVVDSPFNGRLIAQKDLAWGTYIQGGGLTQSGGIARTIWQGSLAEVKKKNKDIKNVLILGFGGGGIVNVIKKHWPECKIVGVDIDPVIVELGKKYLKWDSNGVDVIIDDVENVNLDSKYDLICIDTYVADEFPKKFEKQSFLKRIKKLLANDGIAVFNRLYYDKKRKEARDFGQMLEKIFSSCIPVYPEANIMFLCEV